MKTTMAALVQCVKKLSTELSRQNVQFLHKMVHKQTRFCSSGIPVTQVDPADPMTERETVVPPNYRHVYPEFLPDPNISFRNSLREKLERADMMKRRGRIDIPEFYVGTVMSVTFSDPHAASKTNKFVGICIQRNLCGLRADFTLRNVVDKQGVEMRFILYDPRIQRIDVLRLEKRLDDELFYLRDALPEYCTFPLDMEPELLPDGAPVPVNPIKVKLRPRPWYVRWERMDLQGIQPLDMPEKFIKKAEKVATPWEAYDLMKQYRATVPEEEQREIYAEVYSELHQLELTRKKLKRRRTFQKPTKTG